MRTRFFTNLIVSVATFAIAISATETFAQSTTRRGNNSGNTTTTSTSRNTSTQRGSSSTSRGNSQVGTSTVKREGTTQRATTTSTISTRSTGSSSTVGTRGRNYNDHISNVNSGNNDRPSINNKPANNKPNVSPNKPANDKPGVSPNRPEPKPAAVPNNFSERRGTPTFDSRYVGSRNSVNEPPRSVPRYNRENPNRHLGYTPFRDGRVIHRPALYSNRFDIGVRFASRPAASVKIRFGGLSLYFSNGVWYNHANGYYSVYRPPIGAVISSRYISSDLYIVDFDTPTSLSTTYYVDAYANFYVPVVNYRNYGATYDLQVVNAPMGAVLYDLPNDYKTINYYGTRYYVVGNTVFEYVYSNRNSWYFRAVGVYS